jgi:hypothetical protein
VRELGDATVGQRAAAVWWPSSMVLMAIWGVLSAPRTLAAARPRYGTGEIGTAAAFGRHDTRRHPATSRWPQDGWPLTVLGFAPVPNWWCRRRR